jgi:hypothetical protein
MIRTYTHIGFAIFPAVHLWRQYLPPQVPFNNFVYNCNCLRNMAKHPTRFSRNEVEIKTNFPYVVRRGSGVLSPATHAHPLSSFLLSGRHNTNTTTQHPLGGPSDRDLNPADLAVVSEECSSSFHHPTVSP